MSHHNTWVQGSKIKRGNWLTIVPEITIMHTVKILRTGTGRSEQTVQTQIRLLLQEQSYQGLHCLPFQLHLLEASMYCSILRTIMVITSGVPIFRTFTVHVRVFGPIHF